MASSTETSRCVGGRSALKAYIKENGYVYANTLDTFPAAEVGKWISVKDRPPEHDCFVYLGNQKAVIFAFRDEYTDPHWNVTHWMPVTYPEPPKEKE